MSKRILDTEVLIRHYNKLTRPRSAQTVKEHARQLIELEETHWILSPIKIEFLCGARNSNEFSLYSAYLEPFALLDMRKIPAQDWSEAERLAQWNKLGGRPHKLGDCLIKAIAKRLHAGFVTRDQDFHSRIPPR